jgi:hypothetical protein
MDDKSTFLFREERSSLREVIEEEKGNNCDNHRGNTFKDKDYESADDKSCSHTP